MLAGCAGGQGAGPDGPPASSAPRSSPSGAGSPTAAESRNYSDAQLQSLLKGVKHPSGAQLQVEDPRALVSGAKGDYQDASDPKRRITPRECELFDSYRMLNAATGTLAGGMLIPVSRADQEAMMTTGAFRYLDVIHPASQTDRSEFRQRLEAYSSCNTVREISLLPGKLQMAIVRLPAKVNADRGFAVSQLTSDGARIGMICVGGTKAGVDVIYRQTVNGNAADSLDFNAAAREGADVVNQVLGKLP